MRAKNILRLGVKELWSLVRDPIMLVLIAALAYITSLPSARVPFAAAAPRDQKTTIFAARTSSRLQIIGRSRRRVAFHWSSNKRLRRERKRSTTQPPSPNKRSSLAASGSTASLYA